MCSERQQREVHDKDDVPDPNAGWTPRKMEANAPDDHWWNERMNKDGEQGGEDADE